MWWNREPVVVLEWEHGEMLAIWEGVGGGENDVVGLPDGNVLFVLHSVEKADVEKCWADGKCSHKDVTWPQGHCDSIENARLLQKL